MQENHPKTETKPISAYKLRKNQFKCFRCRQIHPTKDGNWYPWSDMEVHLCTACERQTREQPERLSATRRR